MICRSHFQVSGVVATGTSEMHLGRAGGDAQIAAGAQVAHHGMHGAGRPNDGIHRTGLDTLGTANAVRLVNYREHAGRLRFLCIAVDRLRVRRSARRRFLTSPLRHPARSGLFSHPVRRLLPHRGDTQGTRTAHTGSAAIAHQFFPPPGRPAPRNDARRIPVLSRKSALNRLMAITAIQTALITTSPNH